MMEVDTRDRIEFASLSAFAAASDDDGDVGIVAETATWKFMRVAVHTAARASPVDATAVGRVLQLLHGVPRVPQLQHVLGVCVDAPDGRLRVVTELGAGGSFLALMRLRDRVRECLPR
jgi:hypothetical protein